MGSNRDTATSCGKIRNKLREISPLMRVAQSLWPKKTAHSLASATGKKKRQCEYYLAGKNKLTEDAIRGLLKTDDGLKFLEALMGDSVPTWWAAFRYAVEMQDVRSRMDALREKQRGLARRIK